VRPSTLPVADLPFTVMETVGISYSLLRRVGRLEPSPVFLILNLAGYRWALDVSTAIAPNPRPG
jgi:hypothetical protein